MDAAKQEEQIVSGNGWLIDQRFKREVVVLHVRKLQRDHTQVSSEVTYLVIVDGFPGYGYDQCTTRISPGGRVNVTSHRTDRYYCQVERHCEAVLLRLVLSNQYGIL